MIKLPDTGDALRLEVVMQRYPGWSVFWDKQAGVWRTAEDDPSSELYTESGDVNWVIRYITSHSRS